MYKSEYSQLLVVLISAYFITLWFWRHQRRGGGRDSQETNRQLEYIHTWHV